MDEDLGAAGLRFEREGVIGWCIIDRPEARNALTGAMYYGIKKAVIRVNRDPELAALIITGTGDVFAPGGDLGGRAADPTEAPLPEVGGGEMLPFSGDTGEWQTGHCCGQWHLSRWRPAHRHDGRYRRGQ